MMLIYPSIRSAEVNYDHMTFYKLTQLETCIADLCVVYSCYVVVIETLDILDFTDEPIIIMTFIFIV